MNELMTFKKLDIIIIITIKLFMESVKISIFRDKPSSKEGGFMGHCACWSG